MKQTNKNKKAKNPNKQNKLKKIRKKSNSGTITKITDQPKTEGQKHTIITTSLNRLPQENKINQKR